MKDSQWTLLTHVVAKVDAELYSPACRIARKTRDARDKIGDLGKRAIFVREILEKSDGKRWCRRVAFSDVDELWPANFPQW
ncbi:MAG: hypothetical protein NTX02_03770 [Planctomycetia bacterium]|nr:hypothetical protein [Planctomycetia bacterium]